MDYRRWWELFSEKVDRHIQESIDVLIMKILIGFSFVFIRKFLEPANDDTWNVLRHPAVAFLDAMLFQDGEEFPCQRLKFVPKSINVKQRKALRVVGDSNK